MEKNHPRRSHVPSPIPEGPGVRVVVVGLGISGLWTARWLIRQGTRVVVSDRKPSSDLDPALLEELMGAGVELETGGHREETFLTADAIVVSPGVPHDMPLIRLALEKDIPVMGEMELASRVIHTPMIAVTGTNGKTTVTALVGELLKNAGLKVFVGGNIGTPLMAYAAGEPDADYLVVEVSSFQLDTTQTFRPFISIILNITPDHLDRYADEEAYACSKLRIYEHQGPGDYLILNDDDPRLSLLHPESGVTLLRYASGQRQGVNAFLEEGTVRAGLAKDHPAYCFSLDRFGLPGLHNQENLMAAVLVGMAMGIDARVIQDTIDRFKGLPHRIEYVAEVAGVRFYNDSKATNVDAARRAIASFDAPLVLIAGGRHKGADYGPLVGREQGEGGKERGAGNGEQRAEGGTQGRLKRAVFLGEARGLLAEAFEGAVPYVIVENLEEAVTTAFSLAAPGDVVLLAPACSSFDMFSNYQERGDVFRKAVKGLSHD